MVAKRTYIDDVIASRSNGKRESIATKKVSVEVPGIAMGGRKAKFTFDVSPEGEKMLKDLIAKAERDTRSAWQPIIDIAAYAGKDKRKRPEQDALPDNATEDDDSPADDPENDVEDDDDSPETTTDQAITPQPATPTYPTQNVMN